FFFQAEDGIRYLIVTGVQTVLFRSSLLALLLLAADPTDGLAKKMLPIYLKEAEAYALAVESAPKKALELKREPVFEWSNPNRNRSEERRVGKESRTRGSQDREQKTT